MERCACYVDLLAVVPIRPLADIVYGYAHEAGHLPESLARLTDLTHLEMVAMRDETTAMHWCGGGRCASHEWRYNLRVTLERVGQKDLALRVVNSAIGWTSYRKEIAIGRAFGHWNELEACLLAQAEIEAAIEPNPTQSEALECLLWSMRVYIRDGAGKDIFFCVGDARARAMAEDPASLPRLWQKGS